MGGVVVMAVVLVVAVVVVAVAVVAVAVALVMVHVASRRKRKRSERVRLPVHRALVYVLLFKRRKCVILVVFGCVSIFDLGVKALWIGLK